MGATLIKGNIILIFLPRQGARPLMTLEEKEAVKQAAYLPPLQSNNKGDNHGKKSSNIF